MVESCRVQVRVRYLKPGGLSKSANFECGVAWLIKRTRKVAVRVQKWNLQHFTKTTGTRNCACPNSAITKLPFHNLLTPATDFPRPSFLCG